jgi:hypothetical protein
MFVTTSDTIRTTFVVRFTYDTQHVYPSLPLVIAAGEESEQDD